MRYYKLDGSVVATTGTINAEEITEEEYYLKKTAANERFNEYANNFSKRNPLTNEHKLELLLESIPTKEMPSEEPKLGYKWEPLYSATAGFVWELVEDPTALGTMKNPLYWLPGKSVKMGYHYTDGTTIYVALENGVPSGFDEATYFAEV